MNKSVEEILDDLKIYYSGTWGKNNSYVIDLADDSEWGKIYSILETNEDMEELEESTLLTVHNANLIYEYKDELQFVLSADFDNNDGYRLTVKEI